MIDPRHLLQSIAGNGIEFFTGVPDSLLKGLCACLQNELPADRHVIAANEGNALAIAMGYHLATGCTAAVYLQNSGLGNLINPLSSLLHADVYRIPALLIVGWRGKPGEHDEPQHVKQGRITPAQLELLDVPYWHLNAESDVGSVVGQACRHMAMNGGPVALLVHPETFQEGTKVASRVSRPFSLMREEALRELLLLADDCLVVATTGKTSREVHEIRAATGSPQRDFLCVGGMGHTSSIAFGVALGAPQRRVLCLDGDGSLLMHMGALGVIAGARPGNFVHVLLNNAAHESVGGQPTVADAIDFRALSLALGYRQFERCDSIEGIRQCWQRVENQPGPILVQVDIAVGSRANLGRPTRTPLENKGDFMRGVK